MLPKNSLVAFAVGFSVSLSVGQLQWAGCDDLKESDFRYVPLNTTGSEFMSFDIAGDGRIYYTEKTGNLHSILPSENKDAVVGSLKVQSSGYIGLWGAALDPKFPAKPWIYLYYTPAWKTPPAAGVDPLPEFRISRFVLSGNRLDLASEKMLLEVPNEDVHQDPDGSHTGGKLRFDASGNLYLTTGDNRFWGEYPATNETSVLRAPLATSSNTNDLRGKIIRIRPQDDGTFIIPEGNLFPRGTQRTRPEIFAMGLRNPIGLQIDPLRGWVLVSEAGPDGQGAGGPLLRGGDEFTIFKKPGNGGWPMFHGTDYAYPFKDYVTGQLGMKYNSIFPVNNSKWNTGLDTLPAFVPAAYLINKGQKTDSIGQDGGGMAAVAGPIYRYNPGLPSPIKFPPHFHGKWFVSNYFNPLVGLLTLDPTGSVTSATQVFKNTRFQQGLLEMGFGPDGALYVLSNSSIVKVEYTGNCRPTDLAPFRVAGCMDPAFKEYNPYADASNPSACVTRLNPTGISLGSAPSLEAGSLESVLSSPGRHYVEVFDSKGKRIFRQTMAGPMNRPLRLPLPGGLHWVKVITDGKQALIKAVVGTGNAK